MINSIPKDLHDYANKILKEIIKESNYLYSVEQLETIIKIAKKNDYEEPLTEEEMAAILSAMNDDKV